MLTRCICASLLLLYVESATVSLKWELRDWVVDFRRPTTNPRTAPYQISSDAKQVAYLANNMYPGPVIEVYEGDDVEVAISNQIYGQEVKLVFEGVKVLSSPDHAIPQQGGEFVYKMRALSAGTFAWRAENPVQAASGLKGAILVRVRNDLASSTYQDDRVVVLSDAVQRPDVCITNEGGILGGCPAIDKATLNGQWGDGSGNLPYPAIEVSEGKCHRLRFLGMMSQPSQFQITIQDHTVRSLGQSSAPATPVSQFDVPSGGAFDAVLCANQHPVLSKDYNIAMNYVANNCESSTGLVCGKAFSAVLRYAGSAEQQASITV